MAELPPRRVPWEALVWMARSPIPECQRHEWIMAPDVNYVEASRWADRCGLDVVELVHLATGETLMRVRR